MTLVDTPRAGLHSSSLPPRRFNRKNPQESALAYCAHGISRATSDRRHAAPGCRRVSHTADKQPGSAAEECESYVVAGAAPSRSFAITSRSCRAPMSTWREPGNGGHPNNGSRYQFIGLTTSCVRPRCRKPRTPSRRPPSTEATAPVDTRPTQPRFAQPELRRRRKTRSLAGSS